MLSPWGSSACQSLLQLMKIFNHIDTEALEAGRQLLPLRPGQADRPKAVRIGNPYSHSGLVCIVHIP